MITSAHGVPTTQGESLVRCRPFRPSPDGDGRHSCVPEVLELHTSRPEALAMETRENLANKMIRLDRVLKKYKSLSRRSVMHARALARRQSPFSEYYIELKHPVQMLSRASIAASDYLHTRFLLNRFSVSYDVLGPCARSARIATTILLANPAVKQQCLHCCVSAWRVRQPVKLLALEVYHLMPLGWQRICNTPGVADVYGRRLFGVYQCQEDFYKKPTSVFNPFEQRDFMKFIQARAEEPDTMNVKDSTPVNIEDDQDSKESNNPDALRNIEREDITKFPERCPSELDSSGDLFVEVGPTQLVNLYKVNIVVNNFECIVPSDNRHGCDLDI
ncbi:hypothetical protein MSG28_011620 [Choristoneura fumiferana]|uniref:Uncharacterized protein n=1 Tax=Choristoneura fumiferana TaxID=7141 RepID=A0ACC0JNY2_CHOFU|nr:hypothetical protein MSG28_011620 [Choristoneura fumiferana]